MSITSIIGKLFLPRQKELERHINEAGALQNEVLAYLTGRAKDTEYGRKHIFGNMKSYEDFAANVPLNTYEELKNDIDRMRHARATCSGPER